MLVREDLAMIIMVNIVIVIVVIIRSPIHSFVAACSLFSWTYVVIAELTLEASVCRW